MLPKQGLRDPPPGARPEDDRISSDRQAAGRLARVCGGLPLALQIVAAQLKADPALSLSEFADELAAESKRLQRLRYDDGSGMGAPSVAATFELSYRRLDETSARVFRLLAVNRARISPPPRPQCWRICPAGASRASCVGVQCLVHPIRDRGLLSARAWRAARCLLSWFARAVR